MVKGKALTPEQNARARVWLGDLLRQHRGNASEVGRLLGLSHSTVMRWRDGHTGTSVHVIQRLAELLGRDPAEVLGLEVEGVTPVSVLDPRYPSSHMAQRAAALMGATREDVEEAIRDHVSPEDPGDAFWIGEILRARDRRRRRERA